MNGNAWSASQGVTADNHYAFKYVIWSLQRRVLSDPRRSHRAFPVVETPFSLSNPIIVPFSASTELSVLATGSASSFVTSLAAEPSSHHLPADQFPIMPPSLRQTIMFKQLPAAYEPDIDRLVNRCRAELGKEFAVASLPYVFALGITFDALIRKLTKNDLTNLPLYDLGHQPTRAFHAFVEKRGERYFCGLCEHTGWLERKDSRLHLIKFHFGLQDECSKWYVFILITLLD